MLYDSRKCSQKSPAILDWELWMDLGEERSSAGLYMIAWRHDPSRVPGPDPPPHSSADSDPQELCASLRPAKMASLVAARAAWRR